MYDHRTESPEVLAYVDHVDVFDDVYRVVGWIAHRSESIVSLEIDGRKLDYVKTSRPDVARVYPGAPLDTGFALTQHKTVLARPMCVVLSSGRRIEVGSLRRSVVRKLGFRDLDSRSVVVVDGFYRDPDEVRAFAMNNLDFSLSGYHRGKRSGRFILDGTKEALERVLGRKIRNWNHPEYANGTFQFCVSSDPIVYHVDSQEYAAVVYLTPEAPLESGTTTYRSTTTGATRFRPEDTTSEVFKATFSRDGSTLDFYDSSTLQPVDRIANVYNRLVVWDSRAIHAATSYFGDSIEDSRLFHLFFFDVE